MNPTPDHEGPENHYTSSEAIKVRDIFDKFMELGNEKIGIRKIVSEGNSITCSQVKHKCAKIVDAGLMLHEDHTSVKCWNRVSDTGKLPVDVDPLLFQVDHDHKI